MDGEFLAKTALFQGTTPREAEQMLSCLGAQQRGFSKGAYVYHAGETVRALGLVLSGSACVENDDFWGNKSVLDRVEAGEVFAETYACIPEEPLMVSVVAAEPTQILFLDVGRLLHTCPDACQYHQRLIENLLRISARKNLNLSRRIFHTSAKTIRGRLLSFLSYRAARSREESFTIPFNRQQLADYLGVDRSALSNELSKMQREGLLQVERNRFRLLAGPM